MKRLLLILLTGVAIVLASGAAQARDCKGVTFPEQTVVDGAALVLNGLGLRQATMFKVNVYVAGLYVASRTEDASAVLGADPPKKLVLHFLRDVKKSDLNNAWEKGFADNAADMLPQIKERVNMLTSWMEDMASGSLLIFAQRHEAGVEVNVNGNMRGSIPGEDFARAFFSIWLGPQPPNPGLKTGLLGGVCE